MFLLMGKGSLPQYGQVTVIADIARSGVHMVRSIVALQLLGDEDKLVFILKLSFKGLSLALVGNPSSQRSVWA